MATVKKQIQVGEKPTKEALEEVENAKRFGVTYDDEAPELTNLQLKDFAPAYPEFFKPKKQQITLKLDADIIATFKRTGKGYQTRINAALRKYLENAEKTN
ncbi:MAG: BrnA antitoxin family protein [Treponema sp.]|nr:BrnA antitoxin family protein [Candidatus Treponema scatequi]